MQSRNPSSPTGWVPLSILTSALILLGFGLWLGGCVGSSPAWPDTPVILISIDTLRADRLPVYGYETLSVPAIEGLARDGVVFEHAYAHTPLTLPSHLSILTGRLAHRHGVRANRGYSVELAHQPYLPRLLLESGYRTGAAVSAVPLSRGSGFGADFEFFDDADGFTAPRRSNFYQRPGSQTLEAMLPWLGQMASGREPFFLFFHLFEPHLPYDSPAAFTSPGRSPYDAEVAAADHLVGALLDELRRLDIYDQAIIILLSDHGEGLGDHGETEHGMLLYREVLQVPWIVKLPNNARASQRLEPAVGLIDVMPTLLDLLGLAIPPGLDGRSQMPLIFGQQTEGPARALFAETLLPRIEMGWGQLSSARRGNDYWVGGPKPELYDVAEDPRETHNLLAEDLLPRGLRAEGPPTREAAQDQSSRHRAVADELAKAAHGLGVGLMARVEESSEPTAALMHPASPAGSGREDPSISPRDRIQVYERYRTGQKAFERGDWQLASEALQLVVSEDPGIPNAWLLLGNALDRLGRPGEALEAYLTGGPASARSVEIAGEVLGLCRNLNRLYLCADHLAVFADAQPTLPRLRYLHARTLRELGRHEEALAVVDIALKLAPMDPEAYHLRGEVLMTLECLDEAAVELSYALDLTNEKHLVSLLDLARVLNRQGIDEEEVRRLLQLAREIDPANPSVRALAEALDSES